MQTTQENITLTDTIHTQVIDTENIQKIRIGIVAGEASGDALGASLMQELNTMYPHAEWIGVGGVNMQAQGLIRAYAMERLAVMGLIEVLGRLADLFRAKKDVLAFFETNNIDLFIGIDAPDFNLRLAKSLKAKGIHTIQYVSPSVWVWREKRIDNIKAVTDLVLCLFPFELPVYAQHKHPAVCVGHPLLHELQPKDTLLARQELVWSLEPLKESMVDCEVSGVVGLLPGSRGGEISRIAPIMFATAQLMLEKDPNLRFLVPTVNVKQQKQLNKILSKHGYEALVKAVTVLYDTQTKNLSHDVISASDMVVLASGTVTLEAMLLETPMVVVYKLNSLTYKIAQRMVKIPYYSLPNIIAGKKIVQELIQDKATPINIALHAFDLLHEDKATEQVTALKEVTNNLRNIERVSPAQAVLQSYHASKSNKE